MLKVLPLRIGTGRAFHKAGQDTKKALEQNIVYIKVTKKLFKFVDCRYLEHFGRTSKSARYASWLSFRVRKDNIMYILKRMRNLTGSQCNRLRIGTERLIRGALITTLARQLRTRCNLVMAFSGILGKSEIWSHHPK